MLEKLSKELEKYLALLVVFACITMFGSMAIEIIKTGSGTHWQLVDLRNNIDSFRKIISDQNNKCNRHAHERALQNRAVFKDYGGNI